MATTLSNATLTVTISEEITLNGQTTNSSNILSVGSINEVNKRIVNAPFSTEVTLINFAATVSAGTFVPGNIKHIRITNLDDTNFVRIRAKKAGAETFDVKLEAGKSMLFGNTKAYAHATAGAFAAFVDIDSINVQADTATVDLEVFIAST